MNLKEMNTKFDNSIDILSNNLENEIKQLDEIRKLNAILFKKNKQIQRLKQRIQNEV